MIATYKQHGNTAKSVSLQGKPSIVQIEDYKLCYVKLIRITNNFGSNTSSSIYVKNMIILLILVSICNLKLSDIFFPFFFFIFPRKTHPTNLNNEF